MLAPPVPSQYTINDISPWIPSSVADSPLTISASPAEYEALSLVVMSTGLLAILMVEIRSVVNSAIAAAKRALGIKSPSRVFKEIGAFTTEGFAIGVTDNARVAEDATVGLVGSVTRAITKPLAMMSDIMANEANLNPVITPVMDLANVEAGNRTIGQMLAENQTLSLNAGVSAGLTANVGKVQNGPNNSDVVSAIKDLKDKITDQEKEDAEKAIKDLKEVLDKDDVEEIKKKIEIARTEQERKAQEKQERENKLRREERIKNILLAVSVVCLTVICFIVRDTGFFYVVGPIDMALLVLIIIKLYKVYNSLQK